MKKLLLVLGCLLLGILLMPAFLQPPTRDTVQETALAMEAAKLGDALAAYRDEFGEFPPGGVAEIMRELRGENAKKRAFFECLPTALNEQGELLDPWGTPYQIIFDSDSQAPRVVSAGANRLFDAEHSKRSDDYRSWEHGH